METGHEGADEKAAGIASGGLPSVKPVLTNEGQGIDYTSPHYQKVVAALAQALVALPGTEHSKYLVNAMDSVFRPKDPDWHNWAERQAWHDALQEALRCCADTLLKNNSDLASISELQGELVDQFKMTWAPEYLHQLDEGVAVGPLWPYVQQRLLEIIGNRRVAVQKRKHRIGILFVHGIGNQQQGETLNRCSRPIVEYLGENAQVRTADFRDSGDLPARTIIDMPDEGVSWLMAESWWARQFLVPGFRELGPWLLTIGPYMALAHLGKWAMRRFESVATALRLSKDKRWSWAIGLPLLVIYVLVMLVLVVSLSFLLTISLQVFVLTLGLLSTIPLVRTRAAISRLLGFLSSILGDSLAFVNNPVARGAILTKVRRDLKWLADRAEKVVVVAHSQGAAVAHHALRRGAPPNIKLLISVGSGLGKLERASSRDLGIMPRSTGWVVATFPIYLWFAPTLVESLGSVVVYVGLFYLMVFLVALFSGLNQSQMHLSIDPIRWVDYYASHDPIPNGALASKSESWVDCHEVCNYASFVSDHTGYFENHDEFVPAILRDIKNHLGTESVESHITERVEIGARVRKRRVLWLRLIRFTAGIAVVGGGILAGPKLVDIGSRAVEFEIAYFNTSIITSAIDTTTSLMQHFLLQTSIAADVSLGILGWMCLVVLLAPVYIAARWVWAVWNAADMRAVMKNNYDYAGLIGESGWSDSLRVPLRLVGIGIAVGATMFLLNWNGSDWVKQVITGGSAFLALVLSMPMLSALFEGKPFKPYAGGILAGVIFMLWIAWSLPSSTTLWQPYTDLSTAGLWLVETMQAQPKAFVPVILTFGMPLVVAIVYSLNSKSA